MGDHYCCKLCGLRYDVCSCPPLRSERPKVASLETRWKIPAMTDPFSRHWGQPDGLRDRVILRSDGRATISADDWDRLPQYDRSYPSNVYAGKVWSRTERDGRRYLCWYGPARDGACKVVHMEADIDV